MCIKNYSRELRPRMYESISDLMKQISLGEDSVLELKVVIFRGSKVIAPHRDSLSDELAAMANHECQRHRQSAKFHNG